MAAIADFALRLFAWRHANAIKAKVPYNSQSLIKFTPSYAIRMSWTDSRERKSLRDSPQTASSPPYFMTANMYGDTWAYVFVTSEKPVVEANIQLDSEAEIAMLWTDSSVGETHFRYWKRGRLAVTLEARGTNDTDPVDIRSFTSRKHAKSAFRYDRNLGDALDTVMAPLGLNRKVGPPLTVSEGRFRLVGDPADYDSITLTELNPLEEGESPASDRLRDAINDGNVQAALQAIADGANLRHVSRMRMSPMEFASFSGHHHLV